MPSPKVQFKRGALNSLPQQITDGTIYVTTDEHAMYVDNGNQRIRIGDFIAVNTINDLPASGHAYDTAVYYVRQNNILARWRPASESGGASGNWVQINKAGVVGITDDTSGGNVITGIDIQTDAATGELRLVLTKASVATNDDFTDLMRQVSTNTRNIGTLQTAVETINGDENTSGSILYAVRVAKNALLGNATTYTTFQAVEDAILAMQDDIGSLETGLEDAEDDIEALQTTVGQHTSALNTLNGDANTSGSVANQVAAAIANIVANAPSDFDTLKEIAEWIADHNDDAASLISRVDDAETAITGLQGRMTTAESDIDALESTVGGHTTNITNLQTAVNLLNANSSTEGSVDYKIDQALTSIESDLADAASDASTAIDHLTWKEF